MKVMVGGWVEAPLDHVLEKIKAAVESASGDDLFEDQAEKMELIARIIREKIKDDDNE